MIRPADTHDALLLAALIREAFRDVAQRLNLRPSSSPTHPSNCSPLWIDSAMSAGIRFYIDEQESAPTGCVAIDQPDRRTARIDRLCVLPEYRRKGIGTSLMQRALDEAAILGARQARIRAPAIDKQAMNWLESQGFRPEETEHYPYLPYDVVRMEIVVPEASGDGKAWIHEMRIGDYDEALELWKNTENLAPPPDRQTLARFLKRNPGLSLVARIDGLLVGVILCGHNGHISELSRLAISNDYRRMGIGRALTAETLKRLRSIGIYRTHTLVLRDNEASLDLMQSFGFEIMNKCVALGTNLDRDESANEQ